MTCIPALECSADGCYQIKGTDCGVCVAPVLYDRTSDTHRVHHHQNETTPALSEA